MSAERPRRRWLLLVFVLLLAVGVVRLFVVAASLDTAPGYLTTLARNATLGWLGQGHRRVTEMSGEEQARYWLIETDRLLAGNPTSELARGAAWMLHEPAPPLRILDWQPQSPIATAWPPVKDEAAFELLAAAKCGELAELATRLAPDDPNVWRTRASLLFLPHVNWVDFGCPRDRNWLAVLDEAAAHDPHNALYDYLAAVAIWHTGGGVFAIERLTSNSPERFAEGLARFEKGLKKPFLRGPNDRKALRTFLNASHVEPLEIPSIVSWRLQEVAMLHARDQILILQRNRTAAASNAEIVELLGKCFRFDEQIVKEPSPTILWYRTAATDLSRLAPRYLSDTDALAAMNEQYLAAQLRNTVNSEAHLDVLAASPLNSTTPVAATAAPMSTLGSMLSSLLASIALSFAAMLAALALLAWLAGRKLSLESVPPWRLPALRHGLVWLLALAATGGFYFFMSLGVDSTDLIRALLRLALQGLPLLAVVVLGVVVLKHKWSPRGWLFVLIGLPLFGAALVRVQPWLIRWSSKLLFFDRDLRRDRALYSLSDCFPNSMNAIDWAAARWLLDRGAGLTVVLALGMLLAWYWWWSGRPRRGALATSRRMRTAGLAREIATSSAVVAAGLLLAAVWLLPGVLREYQSVFESQLAQLTPMETYLDDLERAIKAIENDPARMAAIRASVQPLNATLPASIPAAAAPEETTVAEPTTAEEAKE